MILGEKFFFFIVMPFDGVHNRKVAPTLDAAIATDMP
jgi:hypothetical protein